MKTSVQFLLVLAVLLFAVPSFAVPYTDVLSVDAFLTAGSLGNSGDAVELAWINFVTGETYEGYDKYETDEGAGWEMVTGGPADTNLYAYDFGEGANPDYFLIKTGERVALAENAPDYVEYTHFLYENLDNDRYAVIDFNTFVQFTGPPDDPTVGLFEVEKLSHIGFTAPVPEPSTLLLLGAGIAGLAIYRRKKS